MKQMKESMDYLSYFESLIVLWDHLSLLVSTSSANHYLQVLTLNNNLTLWKTRSQGHGSRVQECNAIVCHYRAAVSTENKVYYGQRYTICSFCLD